MMIHLNEEEKRIEDEMEQLVWPESRKPTTPDRYTCKIIHLLVEKLLSKNQFGCGLKQELCSSDCEVWDEAELGRKIGRFSRQYISNLENGHRPISKAVAKWVSEVFEISVARLI